MEKRKVLFVINQFFKGGAETALLNLLHTLSPEKYDIDLLIFDHIDLPNTISLIPELPEWIHVVNIARNEGKLAFLKKTIFKIYGKVTKNQKFRMAAIKYIRSHKYDVAFSYGEWFSSSLVANEVHAARKYVWIHADIDKAAFLHPDILRYHSHFDNFIFVSEHSRQAAIAKYPFLEKQSVVVHNLVDQKSVLSKSKAAVIAGGVDDIPTLVTVANIRSEKNHIRQVEVMHRLKAEGLRFRWLNVGSLANLEQTARLKAAIQKAGLQDDFILMGALENPYPLIKSADAVCVLSDHESWSMVITEAKTLGVPVIATKTSGAKEQIISGETGLLCDFTVEDIAEKISYFLTNKEFGCQIRGKLSEFSSSEETLRQLEPLLLDDKQKILYVFDNINYVSGAKNAAMKQIGYLSQVADMTLFSAEPCQNEEINHKYRVVDLSDNKAFCCLSVPIREVWSDSANGKRIKLIRAVYAVLARIHLDHLLYDWLLGRELHTFMETFDTVCVVSEASKLRNQVSKLQHPRKIQWIHTDYVAWRNQSAWTRAVTKRDPVIYQNYDHIVCLSERLKNRFTELYPHLKDKTVAIPNFIDYERILSLADAPLTIPFDPGLINLITVGRMEQEKRYDRLMEIAVMLKKQGMRFHWYFVGGGKLLAEMKDLCHLLQLDKEITFTGAMENPYPLMKVCDLFVLFSEYEGTPVTIDEAKVLGLPILANDVGGIADMLEDNEFGTLFSSDESLDYLFQYINDTVDKTRADTPERKPYNATFKAIQKKLDLMFRKYKPFAETE